ncbi:MAG TPA: hypothetical protein VF624_13720 [Tepidisphaeraceae bacterium]|jgi:hypothetical protein
MDALLAMKGAPSPVVSVSRSSSNVLLCNYADGSYSIERDGQRLGVWEPGESELCFSAFRSLVCRTATAPACWSLPIGRTSELLAWDALCLSASLQSAAMNADREAGLHSGEAGRIGVDRPHSGTRGVRPLHRRIA